ncbi:MAG: hypothetical protein LBC51_11535 [Treponema sp.]|nr:hypothetical protein [Treponema sp.]
MAAVWYGTQQGEIHTAHGGRKRVERESGSAEGMDKKRAFWGIWQGMYVRACRGIYPFPKTDSFDSLLTSRVSCADAEPYRLPPSAQAVTSFQ